MKKSYIILSQAWYGPANLPRADVIDEVCLRLEPETDDELGGQPAEIVIRWIELAGTATARIDIFEDMWHALPALASTFNVLCGLANCSPTVEGVARILDQLGYEDETLRQGPCHETEGETTVDLLVAKAINVLRDKGSAGHHAIGVLTEARRLLIVAKAINVLCDKGSAGHHAIGVLTEARHLLRKEGNDGKP